MELELLECYNKFTGCGKPNSKYWVIGLEPGGNFNDFCDGLEKPYNIENVLNKWHSEIDWTERYYNRIEIFIQSLPIDITKEELFLTNIFPLNFKGQNDSNDMTSYCDIFTDLRSWYDGLSINVFENKLKNKYFEFIISNKDHRKNNLLSLLEGKKIMIVVGKKTFDYLSEFLELDYRQIQIPSNPYFSFPARGGKSFVSVYQAMINNQDATFINLPHISKCNNYEQDLNRVIEEILEYIK